LFFLCYRNIKKKRKSDMDTPEKKYRTPEVTTDPAALAARLAGWLRETARGPVAPALPARLEA
jgi:hypothetical protein